MLIHVIHGTDNTAIWLGADEIRTCHRVGSGPRQGSSILFDEHNYKWSIQQGGLSDSIENMLAFISIICGVVVSLYFYRLNISAMSEHGFDWLREKTIGWSHTPPVNKIDTHHHCVPPFYAKGEILISAKRFDSPKLTLQQPSKSKVAIQVAGQLPTGVRWLPSC